MPRSRMALAALIGMLALLAGCGGLLAPEAKDIAGRWTSDKGGELVFTADGRFTGVDFPLRNIAEMEHTGALFEGDGDVERVSVAGSWRLTRPPGQRKWGDTWVEIEISIDPISGYSGGANMPLMYTDATTSGENRRRRPELDFWLCGDLDCVVEYHRE